MKKKMMYTAIAVGFALTAILCSACTQKTADQDTGSKQVATGSAPAVWYEKYPEPVTVNIGRRVNKNFLKGEDCTNNQYTAWIKEKLNIDITLAFSQENIQQEMTLALATGTLPDVMVISDPLQLHQLIDADLLADLNGVYDQYASSLLKDMIASFGGKEKAFASAIQNGKLYAIPAMMPGYEYALTWVRKDWLDKLNLPMPTTMDELVATARRFVEADLAGGKQTIGIEISKDLAGIYSDVCGTDPLFNYYNAFPKLWIKNAAGEWQWGSVQPETKQGLEILNQWYKEGIIAKDFVTRDPYASIAAGYPGIVFGPWWIPVWPLNDTVANNAEADWRPCICTVSPDGKYRVFGNNINIAYAIVNKDYAHPEALIKLLNLSAEVQVDFDGKALSDEEVQKYDMQIPESVLHAYSGTNMKWNDWPTNTILRFYNQMIKLAKERIRMLADYKAGKTDGIPATEQTLLQNVINFENNTDRGMLAWQDYTRYKAMEAMLNIEPQLETRACYYPMSTETMQQKWANLKTMEEQVFLKIIMGEEPISKFDTFVSDWHNQGGAEITKEVNEQAEKRGQ